MIEIDGSQGEGGGQIVRSALSLAMCTGQPILLHRIRAKRQKQGLMRQHLVAVQAAAAVSQASVLGAELGSQSLQFVPNGVRAGEYRFSIGSAGSCTLVLQTVLPALLQAPGPSRVVIDGGTHNPLAPPYHFLERSYVPLLRRMGADIDLQLDRFGFYPAGGGQITLDVRPGGPLRPIAITGRGELLRAYAESFVAGIPAQVAHRELTTVANALGWNPQQLFVRVRPADEGPGNALVLTLEYEHVTEVLSSFGQRGVSSEMVAHEVLRSTWGYIASDAAVGQCLADQLLLPMALAGGGSFMTARLSEHAQTNAEVIERFLPVEIRLNRRERQDCLVEITPRDAAVSV